jgi:hypothetical protein
LESWEPTQHLLKDTGKPRKTCVETKKNLCQEIIAGHIDLLAINMQAEIQQ